MRIWLQMETVPHQKATLILEENKLYITYQPAFQECHRETCLPLHVRRSTPTRPFLLLENGELEKADGANTAKDFHFLMRKAY